MGTLYILQTLDVNEWAEVFNVCFPGLVGHFEGMGNSVTKMSQSNICFLSTLGCSIWGFLGVASGKEFACQCRRHKRHSFNP